MNDATIDEAIQDEIDFARAHVGLVYTRMQSIELMLDEAEARRAARDLDQARAAAAEAMRTIYGVTAILCAAASGRH